MKSNLAEPGRRRAPAKKKSYTPVDESLAMVGRLIKSVGPKVGRADPEQLTKLAALQAVLDEALADAVAGLRGDGFSWESIGAAIGMGESGKWDRGLWNGGGLKFSFKHFTPGKPVTRQAALMRFAPRVEPRRS